MIVLADTSVWVDLWRHGNPQLARLLDENRVVLHPLVLGEIALGVIAPRAAVLDDLRALRSPRTAEDEEVFALIERVPLWGRGIGWVDAHLLAASLLDRVRLWTLDQPLARAATDLGVALAT